MRSEIAYVCWNIDVGSDLQFLPGIQFTEELADVNSVHSNSFAVMLINRIAATLDLSFVVRMNSSTKKIPTYLCNILVARSYKITVMH